MIASQVNYQRLVCVHQTIIRHKETASNRNRSRSGRPRTTTSSEDNFIVVTSKQNRGLTALEMRTEVNKFLSKPVLMRTVYRLAAWRYENPIKVPKQKETDAMDSTHRDWTEERFKKLLWTDESKSEILGSKIRLYFRRSAGKKIIPVSVVSTVEHGGG